MIYLSTDPSGSTITGLFEYESWTSYKFSHFEHETWMEHVSFLKREIRRVKKKEKERKKNLRESEDNEEEKNKIFLLYENSNFVRAANSHFLNLIKTIAGLELLVIAQKLAARAITNQAVKRARIKAKNQEIAGIEYKWAKGWYFRGKKLANQHQLDALLVFWVYWTKFKGEDWPWIK